MLETLVAMRYDDRAMDGATEPSKMACRRPDGSSVDVFVKCSWAQCPPGGLAREVVSALLARELSIPAATPAFVTAEIGLIESLQVVHPGMAVRMRDSVSPMYGSIYVGQGFGVCASGVPQDPGLQQKAIEMWAFDHLILNPDRSQLKPNCLVKGAELVAIDHEKALRVEGLGGILLPAPWQDAWIPNSNHLFRDMAGYAADGLDRLHAAWKRIDVNRVYEIARVVPASWDADGVLKGVCEYLAVLHENLDEAFGNLKGVRP